MKNPRVPTCSSEMLVSGNEYPVLEHSNTLVGMIRSLIVRRIWAKFITRFSFSDSFSFFSGRKSSFLDYSFYHISVLHLSRASLTIIILDVEHKAMSSAEEPISCALKHFNFSRGADLLRDPFGSPRQFCAPSLPPG